MKSVCVFIHLCLWFQSVCCSPPWPLLLSALFRHAHRYYFKFFCTQEKLLSIPICTEVVCLYFTFYTFPFMSLSLGCGRAVHSLLSAVHRIHKISLFLLSASSQPCLKVRRCFCVLLSAHTLQRRSTVCSRRVTLSVRS